MESLIIEFCAIAYYCAESQKLWENASENEKQQVLQYVSNFISLKKKPNTRRERAIVSIYSLYQKNLK